MVYIFTMSTVPQTHPTTRKNTGRDLALIAVFAAFIAVCAILPAFPVGPAGVPITFQTLGIYITALVIGGNRGGLATLLYVIVGLLGLPVFAGGGAGFGTLAGPSAGYLLGFIPGAWLCGTLAYTALRRSRSNGARGGGLFGAVIAGFLLITIAGIAGMMLNAGLSFNTALAAAALYIPGDLIKCVIAIIVALAVHRAFHALARR